MASRRASSGRSTAAASAAATAGSSSGSTVSGGPEGVRVTSDMGSNLSAAASGNFRAVLLGAAPGWFADNLFLIAAIVLAVVTFLVLRVVVDVTTRLIILGVVVAVA